MDSIDKYISIGSLQTVEITNNSITLQGDNVLQDNRETKYKIKHKEVDGGSCKLEYISHDENEIKLTNLKPNTSYKVVLYELDKEGYTRKLFECMETTTESIDKYESLALIGAVEVTLNSLTMQWYPVLQEKPESKYEIQYQELHAGSFKVENISHNENEIKLTNLKPNTKYKIVLYELDAEDNLRKLFECMELTKRPIAEKNIYPDKRYDTENKQQIATDKLEEKKVTQVAEDEKNVILGKQEITVDEETPILLVPSTGINKTAPIHALVNHVASVCPKETEQEQSTINDQIMASQKRCGQIPLDGTSVNSILDDIKQVDSTRTSVTVQWKRPLRPKGSFFYAIRYRNVNEWCKWKIKHEDFSKTEFEITFLKPNNSYRVIIAVEDEESGSSEKLYEIIVKTEESLAEKLLCFATKQQQQKQNIPLFKMRPVKEEIIKNGVKILSFIEGESEISRVINSEKNILLVGSAEAGKTTLVDALFNYLAGVVPTDDFRLQITDECHNTGLHFVTKLQTETTTCYSLPKTKYLSNKCSLNIIDIPGFDDTYEKDCQMRIVKQVKALLTTRISTLHAIFIVCPLITFRLTEAQKRVFKGISELFPHDVSDITYCLCTFDDGAKEYVLKPLKDAGIRPKALFRFSNCCLFEKYDDNDDDAQKRWFNNYLNFKQFLDLVYHSDGKSVRLTR